MNDHSHAHRTKVSIDVFEQERTYIKIIAAKRKMTISEFIMSFIRPYIPHSGPNAETKKAMKEIEENKNLNRYKNVDEFWAEMELDSNA